MQSPHHPAQKQTSTQRPGKRRKRTRRARNKVGQRQVGQQLPRLPKTPGLQVAPHTLHGLALQIKRVLLRKTEQSRAVDRVGITLQEYGRKIIVDIVTQASIKRLTPQLLLAVVSLLPLPEAFAHGALVVFTFLQAGQESEDMRGGAVHLHLIAPQQIIPFAERIVLGSAAHHPAVKIDMRRTVGHHFHGTGAHTQSQHSRLCHAARHTETPRGNAHAVERTPLYPHIKHMAVGQRGSALYPRVCGKGLTACCPQQYGTTQEPAPHLRNP